MKNILQISIITCGLLTLFCCHGINISNANEALTAKDAWTNLVGQKFSVRPEFAYIENQVELPNVLIYGDSISIHYTQDVRRNLLHKANVYRLYRNGGDSASFITKMEKMHAIMGDKHIADHWSFEWDVIHFNVGLHDMKYVKNGSLDKVNGQQVASIPEYKNNLRNIVKYLHKIAPKASLIFATTTPVPEHAKGRVAGDAAIYNAAASAVLQDFPDVIINDLYQLTKPNHSQWWSKPGDVHYNEQGSAAQGSQVASYILSQGILN